MLHISEEIPAQFNLLGCRSDNEDWHNNQSYQRLPLFVWEVFQR